MQWLVRSGLVLLLLACHKNTATMRAIDAAKLFNEQYAQQELRASVAGSDCLVLLIRAKEPLDNRAVETMHYGTGDHERGVEQFADDYGFRAVAYRDADERLWTYGSITREEALTMPRCSR